jgi:hypothetical protein
LFSEFVNGSEIKVQKFKLNELMTLTNENVKLIKIKKLKSSPTTFNLEQNYPNPFNPNTVIEFSISEDAGNVRLSIYNMLGEKVSELVNTSLKAGNHKHEWNAEKLASGIYFYELRTDKYLSIKKMILLK